MATSHPAERRTVQRRPGDTISPLRLRVQSSGLSLLASVWDFSILGVGLLANRDFAPGTAFSVQSSTSNKGLPTELSAQVRHARKLPDGTWLLGCSFSRQLTTEDVLTLG